MAFKTSYHSVLDERVIVLDVLDDMDGVLDDVWTSVHCLQQDLGDQAGFNNLDFYREKEFFRTQSGIDNCKIKLTICSK